MNAEILTLAGIADATLSATNEARAQRDDLLDLAKGFTNVTSPESAQTVANVLRQLKGFTRLIEDSRVAVKTPVLDLGKRIDGLARELTNDLETESDRLSRILGTYQAEQKRLEEEAAQRARDKEHRIWQEAQNRERIERDRIAKEEADRAAKAKAEQDELDRKAEEARAALAELSARKTSKSPAVNAKAAEAIRVAEETAKKSAEDLENAKLREQLEADQRKLNEERAAADRNEETGTAMVQARIAGNNVVARKPAGVATRSEIAFEILDIVALYEAAPYLVKMEPNIVALKAALRQLKPDQHLPGVKHWMEAKTHVR